MTQHQNSHIIISETLKLLLNIHTHVPWQIAGTAVVSAVLFGPHHSRKLCGPALQVANTYTCLILVFSDKFTYFIQVLMEVVPSEKSVD